MVSRALVTTALEETWPENDAPVLFLGEWCRLFNRQSKWAGLDATVAPYHWDDRDKLCRDYLYLQKAYESSLRALADQLNQSHGMHYSLRYWRILAGPWLGYFIQMLFDRWFMLRVAINSYEISGARIIDRNPGELVPNDMTDWTYPHPRHQGHLFTGDNWNELICGQILEWMDIPVERIPAQTKQEELSPAPPSISTRRKIGALLSRVLGVFSRPDEHFFISTYLGQRSDIFLQLRLGQVPKLWGSAPAPLAKVDPDARNWHLAISGMPPHPVAADDFVALLGIMIPRHIPTVYLEGYGKLVSTAESLPWPKRPKAIFDSNSWNSDEVFKAWAATRVESCGSSLFIGQHGGNYGMALWNFNEDHQIAISDRFLTWGWEAAGQEKVTPVGNFKDFDRYITPDPRGVALIVENAFPRYSYHMYSVPVAAGQWQAYFEDQRRFIDALPDALRAGVLVRLYSQDYGHQQAERWRQHFPQLALDDGRQPMSALLQKTRIYISTYNATTYLESLTLDFPTIIFWNPAHWELREDAKPYFEQLKAVGVFHETPEDAARQMARIWDDVEGWWKSEAVQSARRAFCHRYAKKPDDMLGQLETLFRSVGSTVEHE
ncbi:MAG: transferase [Betaproteobacteria bacterium]|nr:transferase [Betaproteobacteria bacterium]